MNKKYFFFDIDGTLTDKKTNKVVPSALKALKKLQDNGHFVAIATGRAHYKAINFMREIGLKNMVCNGGHGLVVNEQLVKNAPLDFQKVLAVIEQANQLGYGVLVAPYDNNEVYGKDFLFLKAWLVLEKNHQRIILILIMIFLSLMIFIKCIFLFLKIKNIF